MILDNNFIIFILFVWVFSELIGSHPLSLLDLMGP